MTDEPFQILYTDGSAPLKERFDLWLNLYAASESGSTTEEGLFGASRAGDDTFLGKLEELTGGERSRTKPR